jgi:hypothetical protein
MATFDYSELKAYHQNFQELQVAFDSWLAEFLLNQGMKFLRNVKPRTPVDTGDLRNHWFPAGMSRKGNELYFWFVNTMYYASWVEFGHAKPYKSGATPGSADWVEGYFMMTVTLDEIERQMPRAFETSFRKFMDSLGVL